MRVAGVVLGALLATAHAHTAAATEADPNIPEPIEQLEQMLGSEPFEIVSAEISRPKAKGDITLKAEVAFGGHAPLTVKLRKAEPGAESFNNIPRYDLAAYELQKLLMGPSEYVVPPTALRMVARPDFAKYSPGVRPTFRGSDEVLGVIQYWLHDIKVVDDVLIPASLGSDPVYARHIGQLNVFTFLIQHGDSNVGNFLISRTEPGPRVFSIDHGVAFGQNESDRGELWKQMRVDRLPADTVQALRELTLDKLDSQLGVLIQWELRDGHLIEVTPGGNLDRNRGVRDRGDVVQMGLTRQEIKTLWRQVGRLLKRVDKGELKTF